MAAKRGFLMYYSKGDAIGTRVSVRYRRSGRLSEVVVKRGSTVYTVYSIQDSCTIVRQTFAGQRSWFRVIRTDRLKLRGRGRRGRGGHAHSGPGGWWKE